MHRRLPLLRWICSAAAVVTVVAGCSAARPAVHAGGRTPSASAPGGWWGSPPNEQSQQNQQSRPHPSRHDVLARQMYRELMKHRRPNPCRHNHAAKFVRVSLRRQHLWMCAGPHLVRDTAITSGMTGPYTSTPTGRYAIQPGERNTTLTLITGQQYAVKYWIPFDAPLFGFHDASWQAFPFGSSEYRRHGSHGCVHMPLRAIAFLYRWADVGTPVRITR